MFLIMLTFSDIFWLKLSKSVVVRRIIARRSSDIFQTVYGVNGIAD